jgi:hypothetical protein
MYPTMSIQVKQLNYHLKQWLSSNGIYNTSLLECFTRGPKDQLWMDSAIEEGGNEPIIKYHNYLDVRTVMFMNQNLCTNYTNPNVSMFESHASIDDCMRDATLISHAMVHMNMLNKC